MIMVEINHYRRIRDNAVGKGREPSGLLRIFVVLLFLCVCLTAESAVADIIVDDQDGAPSFSTTGVWQVVSNGEAYLGDFYETSASGAHTATWTPTLPAGQYEVYAHWRDWTTYSTDVVFTVVHAGVSTQVHVNQYEGLYGGSWGNKTTDNYLGTFCFDGGADNYVTLSHTPADANDLAAADAIKFVPATPETVIIDNLDPEYSENGSWHESGAGNEYQGSSRYSNSEGATATWAPNLPYTGTYKVYAWWDYWSTRDLEAPYTVNYMSGSDTVVVNQQADTSQWNLLGTYCFEAGSTGNVQITRHNGGNHSGSTSADAVKFVFDGCADPCACVTAAGLTISDTPLDTQLQPAPANIMFVLDDSGSMDWEFMTENDDGKFYIAGSPPGDDLYEYVFDDPGDDVYPVWSSNGDILSGSYRGRWKSQWSGYNKMYYNPRAKYDPWPTLANADPGNPRSHPYHSSPTFNLSAAYYTVSDEIVIDNLDGAPGFTSTGDWYTSSGPNPWEGNSKYARYTAATATWTPDIPTTGDYEVFAYWTTIGDRMENAPYTVHHAGGNITVTVNQRQNGATWYSLGVHTFNAGATGYVTLSHTPNADNDHTCADAVKFVPVSGGSQIAIANAHYYTWDDADADGELDAGEDIYLVNLDGAIAYYRFDDADGDNQVETGELTLVPATSVPDSVKKDLNDDGQYEDRTYAAERQNFANWYSFYRRRELTATAAVANVINNMQGVQIGINSINGKIIQPVRKIKVGGVDETADLLDAIYSYDVSAQGTPLRAGLQNVGEYLNQDDGSSGGIGASPFASAADGGECQQCFTIVMTDGYYNGSCCSGIGNEDSDNGIPYADGYSDTLGDVAMYYYENDLAAALDNLVPTSTRDDATNQHMVTYGVSFGVTGTLNPADYDLDDGPYPAWPDPAGGDQGKIDDLWHASVNGHGVFLSAGNPQELVDSLLEVMHNIEVRVGSAASVSVNGDELYEELSDNILMFQTNYFSDGWMGDLKAFNVDSTTGEVITDTAVWSAADELENFIDVAGHGNRIIATYNGVTGIPFRYADLTAAQQAALNSDSLLVDYLRGADDNEEKNGGSFRTRFGPLGDMVDSRAVYNSGNLYVGGNDGMLHAFVADTGAELFSYIPGQVIANLSALADPGYTHKFFVDNTPYAKNMGNTTLLVGGLGKGGKGYYCLDISNADEITSESILAGRVMWEYPAGGTDDDLGYTYSQAYFVKTNDTSINTGTDLQGYAVIFGNGYDSTNGKAILYVIDPLNGTVLKKIDTQIGSGNGLSTPTPIDANNDFMVDYVYAGDLRGHLWKFDLTSSSYANWDVAYKDGSTPAPLFSTKTGSCGVVQPITAKPDVMYPCGDNQGYMVIFATGRYLGEGDLPDTTEQTIYGIWDYGDDDDDSEYLGTFDPDAASPLSNQPADVTLLQQTSLFEGGAVIAGFNATATDTPNSAALNFTDQSSGTITGWQWDFGDNATSSLQNPLHTYTEEGAYTVTLTVTGAGVANNAEKENFITVSSTWPVTTDTSLDVPPEVSGDEVVVADFTGTATGNPAAATINFSDASSGPVSSWYWDFGDGVTSTTQNPDHTYSTAGTYTVALTVYGPSAENTFTKSNYITVTRDWAVTIDTDLNDAALDDVWLRVLSDNTPNWHTTPDDDADQQPDIGPADYAETIHAGWYFDLPIPKEKVTSNVMIRNNKAIVISFVPQSSPCSGGGFSVVHEINACTGGQLAIAAFDINDDRIIDRNDTLEIEIDNPDNPGETITLDVAPTGRKYEGRLHPPAILRDAPREIKYFSSSAGIIETMSETAERRGLYYWRELE